MKYFSSFRFEEGTAALVREGKPVRLTRKASELLRCLVDRAGMLVTHDAILATVWPHTHVQPENVKVLIRELRQALGDDPRQPRFIRSDPGRGYTFVAETSDSPARAAERSLSGVPEVFVDRVDALGVLSECLRGASEFQSRLVMVEGERGIGKTALCDAFLDVIRRQPNTRFAYGQSIEHIGAAEPYLPLLEALGHLTRQFSVELQTTLASQAPGWLERLRRWSSSELTPGAHVSVPSTGSRMTRELLALFDDLSQQGTTVLILEDLHWADVDSIEVLRAIGRHHSPLRLLVVATVAPYENGAPGQSMRRLAVELQGSASCVRLKLRALTLAHVGEYLAMRFETDGLDRLAKPLYAVTQGHPFFMVTALDAMVSAGYISWQPGGWRLTLPTRMLESVVSESVLEARRWQIDQLEGNDRHLLEVAAAVGLEFSAMQITTALGGDDVPAIGHRLNQLADRGFLQRSGGWTGRRVIYRFTHPSHADCLLHNADPFRQLGVSQRLTTAFAPVQRRRG